MNKMCRICWNTQFWRKPTKEAAQLETSSYVSRNEFGHEEWLFNFAWLQPGPRGTTGIFRYGFLQPIGKYRETYEGETLNVLLYSVDEAGKRIGVATIKDLFVPSMDELASAQREMRSRGWIDEMKTDLRTLGIDPSLMDGPPNHMMNVRFRMSDVGILDPQLVFNDAHPVNRNRRYQPLNWDGDLAGLVARPDAATARRRSEQDRRRRAVDETTYSPEHVKLQNALYDYLCREYDAANVHYERDFVDLKLHHNNEMTFFEIKTSGSAKSCIRHAIGQLLEYGIYPAELRAAKFVVVGDCATSPDDAAYLGFLRREYRLPIYYQCWNWPARRLEPLI